MDKRTTDALAQFCIDQRHAFAAPEWHVRFDVDGKAVALAAKYLSMTSWYGHEEELERIAAATAMFHETSHGLYRESQAIGFDLPYFSARVRLGIAQGRKDQEIRLQDPDPESGHTPSSGHLIGFAGFQLGCLA